VTDSEAMLIARAQLDDGEAQQEIYRRHAQASYQRLTRLLGRDPEREDLLQQVFSELFVGLHRFRGDAQLRTYIFRITSNVAYDHLKRRSRRRWLFGASDDVDERAAAQRSPESIAALQQQLDVVWRHLDRLTPKKRIALLLRVGEGLSLEEIGEQVGARVSTVAKRIKYARQELAQMVERERRRQSPG
jgi:RNA polymerase sigma-70 factor (ECF subfamily)